MAVDVCAVLKDNEGQTGILMQQLEEKKREVDEGWYIIFVDVIFFHEFMTDNRSSLLMLHL